MKRNRAPKDTSETGNAPDYEHRRGVCTHFLFWTVCRPRCQRAKSCMGDPKACFERWWPHVPADMKNWFRFSLKALDAGMTPQQAGAHAEAEVARWNEIERGWAAEKEAQAAAMPATPAAAAPAVVRSDRDRHGPRIRQL